MTYDVADMWEALELKRNFEQRWFFCDIEFCWLHERQINEIFLAMQKRQAQGWDKSKPKIKLDLFGGSGYMGFAALMNEALDLGLPDQDAFYDHFMTSEENLDFHQEALFWSEVYGDLRGVEVRPSVNPGFPFEEMYSEEYDWTLYWEMPSLEMKFNFQQTFKIKTNEMCLDRVWPQLTARYVEGPRTAHQALLSLGVRPEDSMIDSLFYLNKRGGDGEDSYRVGENQIVEKYCWGKVVITLPPWVMNLEDPSAKFDLITLVMNGMTPDKVNLQDALLRLWGEEVYK